jgi:hypothetical protein
MWRCCGTGGQAALKSRWLTRAGFDMAIFDQRRQQEQRRRMGLSPWSERESQFLRPTAYGPSASPSSPTVHRNRQTVNDPRATARSSRAVDLTGLHSLSPTVGCRVRRVSLGLFERADPLRLLPFELRFLARRAAPERWVIDLGRNYDTLIGPQTYFQVADPVDRLFIPAEYVPLFVEKGWHRPQ